MSPAILGWDIGGVNTKVTRLEAGVDGLHRRPSDPSRSGSALSPSDYTCPTPDGRPPTREYAGERLARTVCAFIAAAAAVAWLLWHTMEAGG